MANDYQAIDAVVNIWTAEALSHRPGWTDEFFVGKVKGEHDSGGISLEQMLAGMDAANIQYGFLVAAKSGRVGLPGWTISLITIAPKNRIICGALHG